MQKQKQTVSFATRNVQHRPKVRVPTIPVVRSLKMVVVSRRSQSTSPVHGLDKRQVTINILTPGRVTYSNRVAVRTARGTEATDTLRAVQKFTYSRGVDTLVMVVCPHETDTLVYLELLRNIVARRDDGSVVCDDVDIDDCNLRFRLSSHVVNVMFVAETAVEYETVSPVCDAVFILDFKSHDTASWRNRIIPFARKAKCKIYVMGPLIHARSLIKVLERHCTLVYSTRH